MTWFSYHVHVMPLSNMRLPGIFWCTLGGENKRASTLLAELLPNIGEEGNER